MAQRIIITGASSGIGRALALQYARDRATLGILGRNRNRLEMTAAECRKLGADVDAGVFDVRDRPAMTEWIAGFDAGGAVDLVIANAGVMEGTAPGQHIEAAEPAYTLMQTNVLGTLNTIQPLLPAMIARQRGQIAILSSIAGFIPLPDAPSYSASKAALTNYGLALRALLRPHRIGVSVFCLGYVDTPMLQREHGTQPFKMSVDKAAAQIVRGIDKNKALVIVPWFFGYLTRIGGLLPDRVRQHTMRPFRFTVSDRDQPN
jgi:short-subunit dehydrogenase